MSVGDDLPLRIVLSFIAQTLLKQRTQTNRDSLWFIKNICFLCSEKIHQSWTHEEFNRINWSSSIPYHPAPPQVAQPNPVAHPSPAQRTEGGELPGIRNGSFSTMSMLETSDGAILRIESADRFIARRSRTDDRFVSQQVSRTFQV